ncbi:unnamed protein product [Rhizoctonia solani]|uniref:Protein kinase domain-containing protein n=1 Tax=Rhizoctonia solani TaxID=456999 RepID=A0A8H3HER4_9AGAM|nr:unnamed protein product [Rhizoctonia solani]
MGFISPDMFRSPSPAYWRPPTATGLNLTDPLRADYRPPPSSHGYPLLQRKPMWKQVQKEARYSLSAAEEALARRRARRSRGDSEYDERFLAQEEQRLQLERNRVAKLRADNNEWLSQLVRKETDRIHAAMIEDELEGRLTADESAWLENNIQKRKAEAERQSMKRVQEEAERLRKLEEEEEAAKLRATQAEELAQAVRECRILPIPHPEELLLDPASFTTTSEDDSTDLWNEVRNAYEEHRLPRPHSAFQFQFQSQSQSHYRPQRTYESSIHRMPIALADEPSPIHNVGIATQQQWADSLRAEWDRRSRAHEEYHHHDPEAIATTEETEYRERQVARATREAQEAAAARKAFEEELKAFKERKAFGEERKRLEYERRMRKNEEDLRKQGRQLTFCDIPRPVLMLIHSVEELQPGAIGKFLLSPCHSHTKTRKMRLDDALIQWHPDTFAHPFDDRINKEVWPEIVAGINSVACAIKLLINESGGVPVRELALKEESSQEQVAMSTDNATIYTDSVAASTSGTPGGINDTGSNGNPSRHTNPPYEQAFPGQQSALGLSVLDTWNSYQSRCSALSASSPSQRIGFRDIPWPLLHVPEGPESITPESVSTFILSPSHSQGKSRKERLRDANSLNESPDKKPTRVFTPAPREPKQDTFRTASAIPEVTEEGDRLGTFDLSVLSSISELEVGHTDKPDSPINPSAPDATERGVHDNSESGQEVNGEQASKAFKHEPRTEVISRQMPVSEVVSHLVVHGCQDLTHTVDHNTFSEYAISKSGFSDVYHARLEDSTQVAIKVLRISIHNLAESPKHLKHAARELHTWSKCKHPNVLPLLGFGVFRGGIGMVSPWMGQGTLPRYLERNPDANRCNLCIQICIGLAYLHEIEIIHGDLKGANVLISDDGYRFWEFSSLGPEHEVHADNK